MFIRNLYSHKTSSVTRGEQQEKTMSSSKKPAANKTVAQKSTKPASAAAKKSEAKKTVVAKKSAPKKTAGKKADPEVCPGETAPERVIKADFKTGFIEVPLQLQLGIPLGDALRIYGIAEPFAGYAIYNKSTAELTSGADTETEEKNNWDNVKSRLEYGFGFGAGVEIMNNVQLSVRYFWNLGKIYDDSEVSIDQNVNTIKHEKCNGIMASLGIFF